MARQIIESGGGCAVIDPAGDLANDIISLIPDNRLKDVIVFDASDEYPIGFNPLEAHSESEKYLLSSDLVALFRRYSTAWGSLMEAATAQAINAFLFNSRVGTLPDLKRFLIDKNFRREVLQTVDDDTVRSFWEQESSGINAKSLASVLIRLDGFLRHPLIRNIVSHRSSKLNFRDIIDRRQILLIKISQGLIGQENAALLGSFLISKLYQIALSRQDSDAGTREPFFIFADEIQNYLTPSLGLLLAGTRKYGVGLAAAIQSFKILQNHDADVAESILTNCLTRISFRLGDEDAKRFANGFSYFTADDLQNLRVGEAIARIERANCDFNLKTFPLQSVSEEIAKQRRKVIIDNTRQNYAGIRSTAKTRIQAEPPAGTSAQFPAPPKVLYPQTDDETGVESVELTPVAPDAYDEEPVSRIGVKPNIGRGGKHHHELQSVIKRMAESYGFHAEIAKVLPGGGRVDVSLENGDYKLACEVSVTTVDYEITNVLKCLEASYNYALVVVSNQKKLPLLKSKLYTAVPLEHHDQVKAFGLSGLLGFLRDLAAPKETHQKREGKPPEQRLNFTDACEFFGVGTSTLYRWIREGRVLFYRPGREYQFDRDELVLIGRQDLSGKRKAVVKLSPLVIEKTEPKSKKEEHSRYRKMLKLD